MSGTIHQAVATHRQPARNPDVGVVVATGEERLFSNILVTIGVA